MKRSTERFVRIDEIAESLAMAPRTVRRWIKEKALVAHRFGRAVRVSESELQRFLDGRRGDDDDDEE